MCGNLLFDVCPNCIASSKPSNGAVNPHFSEDSEIAIFVKKVDMAIWMKSAGVAHNPLKSTGNFAPEKNLSDLSVTRARKYHVERCFCLTRDILMSIL